MTRVLIVDDDPQQLRLLARVIATRQPGLSVVTANSGETAIEQLRAMPVDLVLTDLQMPDVNGFGLVTWLHSHQPHVQVFTMTAYPDDDAVERLRALGSVECYTKPLDVAMVLERLSSTIEQGMRGHVRNISLTSLLQLIEMERKTCTLTVESAGRTGYLYIAEGVLIDARCDTRHGDEAAIEVARWASPAVTIINTCATKQRSVEHSVRFIIMEALRLSDEAVRGGNAASGRPPAPHSDPDELALGPWSSTPPKAAPGGMGSGSLYPVSMPSQANAIAIVEAGSGRVRTSAGDFANLDAVAELVASVFAQQASAVERMQMDEVIEEMVMTTNRYWALTRPLQTQPPSLAMVIFDPQRANVVLERLELDAFVAAFQAWSALRPV